jgi:hypothetical protein
MPSRVNWTQLSFLPHLNLVLIDSTDEGGDNRPLLREEGAVLQWQLLAVALLQGRGLLLAHLLLPQWNRAVQDTSRINIRRCSAQESTQACQGMRQVQFARPERGTRPICVSEYSVAGAEYGFHEFVGKEASEHLVNGRITIRCDICVACTGRRSSP